MQREKLTCKPHPAEAISQVVFEACCRTLGALRFPCLIGEFEEAFPELEYDAQMETIYKNPQPFLDGRDLEHPINHVEWDDLLDNMNRPTWNDRNHPERTRKHQRELLHCARFHPQCVLPTAVRQANEILPESHSRFKEKPIEAAKPFPLLNVLAWLDTMDLIEEREDGTIIAKSNCFHTPPWLERSALSLDTVRYLADWVTGPFAPPAWHLHFHLRGLNGMPECSREILFLQGLSALPETHLALLHMLPHWGEGRRRVLRDMILARWIRSMQFFCNNPTFKAEQAACLVFRWSRICRHLECIPRVAFHSSGSSAGF